MAKKSTAKETNKNTGKGTSTVGTKKKATPEKKKADYKKTETIDKPMTGAENKELKRLETKIANANKSWLTIGECLFTISTKKLYRGAYKTFAEYVVEHWDYSQPKSAYRLIQASKIVETLKAEGFKNLPAIESQARPLEKYLTIEYNTGAIEISEKLIEIWTCVDESVNSGTAKITAKMVDTCVAKLDKESLQAKKAKEKAELEALKKRITEGGDFEGGESTGKQYAKDSAGSDSEVQLKKQLNEALEQVRAQKAKVRKLQDDLDITNEVVDELKELLNQNGIDYSSITD